MINMKTNLTKEIEKALIARTQNQKGVYGALEVTSTKTSYGAGYERCDYVEFTSASEITCYEIKISLSDFLSQNKQTYLGDRNYLVIPEKLLKKINESHHLQGGVEVIVYDQGRFQVAKRCSKRIVSISERVALLEGIARSASRDFMKDYCDN